MTYFRLFQNEIICREELCIFDENSGKFFKRVADAVGYCLLQVIPPFPIAFSKDLCYRHVKNTSLVGEGLRTMKRMLWKTSC